MDETFKAGSVKVSGEDFIIVTLPEISKSLYCMSLAVKGRV